MRGSELRGWEEGQKLYANFMAKDWIDSTLRISA